VIECGREILRHVQITDSREWLVTNGLGGYASGTITGKLASRYHGLLIAALEPPLGRTLLLSHFDEQVSYDGQSASGGNCLSGFRLAGSIPVWTFAISDALLEKRIWMRHEANTTLIRYTLARAAQPLSLTCRVFVNYRDSHLNTHRPDWQYNLTTAKAGVRFTAFPGAVPFHLHSDTATFTQAVEWHFDHFLSIEAGRGLDAYDDQLAIGSFVLTLNPGASVTFVASTEPITGIDGTGELHEREERDRMLLDQSGLRGEPDWIQQLVLAADQFLVRRPLPNQSDGMTVLAGYPWFSDWGRDTMIALPGLTLTTQRYDLAAAILRTFARYADHGMLPNRFPDAGQEPEYNTVDAGLWYFQAVGQYVTATGDLELLHELYPVLVDMIAWHVRGARFGIHVDPIDGLLSAGEPDVQLTWMDVKIHTRYLPVTHLLEAESTRWLPAFIGLLQRFGVPTPNWVVTPRTGKQVEINALWYSALMWMASFAAQLGYDPTDYTQRADRVRSAFARFWNPSASCCCDVLDTPDGDADPTVRPNQILAASLPHSPLSPAQQRQVVDVCARQLLTEYGLRSLPTNHPDYQGIYGGNLVMRDAAYHQGTIWSWLIGAFVEAHLRVYGDQELARSFLLPFKHHLMDHGLGSISEVFSGDAPHQPGGCLAQAWGVAEVLRAWRLFRSRV